MSVLTNLKNAFYQFRECWGEDCTPSYDGCLPMVTTMPLLGMRVNYQSVTPELFNALVLPLPCDYWNCGVIENEGLDNQLAVIFGGGFYPEIPDQCSNILDPDNTDFMMFGGYNIFDIYNILLTGIDTMDFGKCFCFYSIVVEFDEDNVYVGHEVLGKTRCLTMLEANTCGVVKLDWANIIGASYDVDHYTGTSYGFPSANTWGAYFYGRIWKPTIKNEGVSYTKSNGEVLNVKDWYKESWQLEARITDYTIVRAINTALKSEACTMVNQDQKEFNGDDTITQYDYYIEEDMNIEYPTKKYMSAMMRGKIIQKQPLSTIRYNC